MAHNGGVTTTSPSPRARPSHDDEQPASLTGRALILGLVLVALALSLVLPLREFVQQRSQMAELTARSAAAEKSIAELSVARDRWADPAYLVAQARSRLHLVLPGETAFLVTDPEPAAAPVVVPPSPPWYQRVWAWVTRQG